MEGPVTISGNRMHALSVDVEDYFHVEAFTDQVPREAWNGYESRVEANTNRLLELFAKHNARATFFILGWVAERFPRLVRDIAIAGHEIGCHSYAHYPIWKLTPAQFREDTARALMAIEDASGKAVDGYR